MSEPPKDSTDSWVGFFFLAAVAGLVFSLLPLSTQRNLYFRFVGAPAVPVGNYSAVLVRSSKKEEKTFGPDLYVIELIGISNPYDQADAQQRGLDGASGIEYTLHCEPKCSNRCGPLSPQTAYFARWVTTDRKELAIGEAEVRKDGTSVLRSDSVQVYTVRSWRETKK